MAEDDRVDFEKLAARLVDPAVPLPSPAEVKTGADSAARGRSFLLREYGSESAVEEAMRAGRPRVGSTKRGPSPVVRGAIPEEEYEALQKLVASSGLKEAQLVRMAIHKLLIEEKLVV